MRMRNGALRFSIAWPGSAAVGCMDAEDAAATECVTGASADLIGHARNGTASRATPVVSRQADRIANGRTWDRRGGAFHQPSRTARSAGRSPRGAYNLQRARVRGGQRFDELRIGR